MAKENTSEIKIEEIMKLLELLNPFWYSVIKVAIDDTSLENFINTMVELERLQKSTNKTFNEISDLIGVTTNADNNTYDFNKYAKEIKTGTYDNFNEVAPWLTVAGFIPELSPVVLGLTLASLGISGVAAELDSEGSLLASQYQMPESAQAIFDYSNKNNEKVSAVINEVDENENAARKCLDNIRNLVDENGKLKDSNNLATLIAYVSQMKAYYPEIELTGDRIRNYPNLDNLIDKSMKENRILQKKDNLDDLYIEAKNNFDTVKTLLDESQQPVLDALNNYYYLNNLLKESHGPGQVPYGCKFSYEELVEAAMLAEKIAEEAVMDYAAMSALLTSYDNVIKIYEELPNEEYDFKYPDGRKTFPQLEGEAREKREKEKHNVSPAEYKLKVNSERESRYRDAEKPLQQLEGEAYAKRELEKHNTETMKKPDQPYPTDIVTRDEKIYNNEQPPVPVQNVPNTIYTPEMTELTGSLINAVISQAAVLPETMGEIGQQSRDAFIEGLLMDKEYIAETATVFMDSFITACCDAVSSNINIGEITAAIFGEQDMYSIGYKNGEEFAEGFNNGFDANAMFERLMSVPAAASTDLISGQAQQYPQGYYGGHSWSKSNDTQKIVLENKADLKVVLDRDVLGKSVYEWTKEYERRIGK